ncbi:hypothetical protein Lmor_1019 [Legionella moravica]|uniref:Transposase and inactivated derivatives n=1 Tax=Legionella moravica TaxID=39962 RepID=A0A378JXF2_9GAMM|nr:hypothetical protein Lmor_1019 [Legionella moravica]STX62720.1 Transposase and inactivated derivatives [Legionella moravica]
MVIPPKILLLTSVIFREITKLFPSDESAKKVVYLVIIYASKKWTMPIRNWRPALNRFKERLSEFVEHMSVTQNYLQALSLIPMAMVEPGSLPHGVMRELIMCSCDSVGEHKESNFSSRAGSSRLLSDVSAVLKIPFTTLINTSLSLHSLHFFT